MLETKMMNRQLRRAQKKADDRASKEKERAKAARVAKRQERIAKRSEPKKLSDPNVKKQVPGRYSRIWAIVTGAIIVMQAVSPPLPEGQDSRLWLAVEVIYYPLFAYFVYLWLAREGRNNALLISLVASIGLAVLLGAVRYFAPWLEPDLRLMLLAIPAAVAGTFLAKFIFTRVA
jgi:hypothetical protein